MSPDFMSAWFDGGVYQVGILPVSTESVKLRKIEGAGNRRIDGGQITLTWQAARAMAEQIIRFADMYER